MSRGSTRIDAKVGYEEERNRKTKEEAGKTSRKCERREMK